MKAGMSQWLVGITIVVAAPAARAQAAGCEVVMPTAFRLRGSQAATADGVPYPARTRIRAIAFGSSAQGPNRAVWARVDTAMGWVNISPVLVRGCPRGAIADRPGDVAATDDAAPSPSSPPAAPPEPARVCVPGSTQACLCVSGGSGVQSCAPSGAGYEACACAPPPVREAAPESNAPPPAPPPTPAAPAVPPVEALRRAMGGAVTDALARQVRALLHPTGGGGALGTHSVACTDSACVGSFTVLWTGGVLRSAYQSDVRWTVQLDGSSSAELIAENSIIRADGQHIGAMGRYLAGVASRLASHP